MTKAMTKDNGDLPPGFGDPSPDDETVTGQIKGPWVVQARICQGAIQALITGGEEARSGVDTYDRSVTLAGPDWRPLVVEAVTEMQRRTGLPINIECTQIYGVFHRIDLETDGFEAIAEQVADILSGLGGS